MKKKLLSIAVAFSMAHVIHMQSADCVMSALYLAIKRCKTLQAQNSKLKKRIRLVETEKQRLSAESQKKDSLITQLQEQNDSLTKMIIGTPTEPYGGYRGEEPPRERDFIDLIPVYPSGFYLEWLYSEPQSSEDERPTATKKASKSEGLVASSVTRDQLAGKQAQQETSRKRKVPIEWSTETTDDDDN